MQPQAKKETMQTDTPTNEPGYEFTGETTFKDKFGHQWDVSLDLFAIKRIEASDFSALGYKKPPSMLVPSKEFLTDCITNTSLMFAMMWAVVQPQILQRFTLIDPDPTKEPMDNEWPNDADGNPDEMEFLRRMNGPSIDAAKNAWWEAVADFFPQHRIILCRLITMYRKATDTINTKVNHHLTDYQTTIDQVMDQEIEKGLQQLKEEIGTKFSK